MERIAVWLISIAILILYSFVLFRGGYVTMIFVFICVALVGVLILLIARYAIKREQTVTLAGVGPGFALESARQSIFSAEDHLVGFPSGSFEIATWSDQGFEAKEFIPKGSGSVVMRFIRIPGAFATMLVAIGSEMGLIGFFIGLIGASLLMGAFLVLFVVPLTLAWLVEIALKPLVRSDISVSAVSKGDVVDLVFVFRGLSAFFVEKKVLSAFRPPNLPAKYSSLAGESVAPTFNAEVVT